MRKVFLFLLLAATPGCATLKSDQTICPEYRNLRCATAPECSMDRQRGCMVCQCAPATADQDGRLPTGVAPDRR